MGNHFPEFETDGDLEAWFDNADLGVDKLEPALEVEIGDSVELVLDEPWSKLHDVSSVSATSSVIRTRVPA